MRLPSPPPPRSCSPPPRWRSHARARERVRRRGAAPRPPTSPGEVVVGYDAAPATRRAQAVAASRRRDGRRRAGAAHARAARAARPGARDRRAAAPHSRASPSPRRTRSRTRAVAPTARTTPASGLPRRPRSAAVELLRPVRRQRARGVGERRGAARPAGAACASPCSTPASPTATSAASSARPTSPARVRRALRLRRRHALPGRPQRPRHARRRHDRRGDEQRHRRHRPRVGRDDHAGARARLAAATATPRRSRKGIRYAARHGAQVINMSLEFSTSVRAAEIPDITAALRYANQPRRRRRRQLRQRGRGADRLPGAHEQRRSPSARRPTTAASPTSPTTASGSTSSPPAAATTRPDARPELPARPPRPRHLPDDLRRLGAAASAFRPATTARRWRRRTSRRPRRS